MRENYKEWTDSLKEKYGVDKIYSYSQLKLFDSDPYEYYLKYIKKVEPDILEDSPYGLIGGMVHDLLEQFYKNEIKRSECKELFINQFSSIISDPKTGRFSKEEDLNRNISDNFQRDIIDYFSRVQKLEGKVLCEDPVSCLLSNEFQKSAFLGYIDFLNFRKDGKIQIIDYKTSSLYKEKDIDKYSRQLLLYAHVAKEKYNKDYEDILVGWNFLKYAKVVSIRDMSEEIVERRFLKEYDPTEYIFEDYIRYIDFNQNSESDLIDYLLSTTKKIEESVSKYNETGSDDVFMYTVTYSDMFRLNNFCKYSEKLHRPLREYLRGK